MASCLEAIRKGDVEKLVITQGGKPVAVLLSVEEFERLTRPIGDQFAESLEEINSHHPPEI